MKIFIYVTGESEELIKVWADFFYYYQKIIKIEFEEITEENNIYSDFPPEDRIRLLITITTNDVLTKDRIMNFLL